MTDITTWSADRSTWDRTSFDRGLETRNGRAARDDERCRQCHFLWLMHPERYDPEEDAMVRFCSEFPVEPIQAIEGCIGP